MSMNTKNTAIKRIMADVRELNRHPSSRYSAAPLENNCFEWHFTIRGPAGSDFEGGVYHGRILLPSEYPFKPPNIIFLTKNGRFEVGTKICLSISAYHEETWQPAWGVRTMLEAIISFMPTEGAGAIGALEWTKEERQKLAKESRSFCCPTCGLVASLLTESDPTVAEAPDAAIAEQIAQLKMSNVESGKGVATNSERSAVGDATTTTSFSTSSINASFSRSESDSQKQAATTVAVTATITASTITSSSAGIADVTANAAAVMASEGATQATQTIAEQSTTTEGAIRTLKQAAVLPASSVLAVPSASATTHTDSSATGTTTTVVGQTHAPMHAHTDAHHSTCTHEHTHAHTTHPHPELPPLPLSSLVVDTTTTAETTVGADGSSGVEVSATPPSVRDVRRRVMLERANHATGDTGDDMNTHNHNATHGVTHAHPTAIAGTAPVAPVAEPSSSATIPTTAATSSSTTSTQAPPAHPPHPQRQPPISVTPEPQEGDRDFLDRVLQMILVVLGTTILLLLGRRGIRMLLVQLHVQEQGSGEGSEEL